jgi:hypothetical protein
MFWPCNVKGNLVCPNDAKVDLGFSKFNLKVLQTSLQNILRGLKHKGKGGKNGNMLISL